MKYCCGWNEQEDSFLASLVPQGKKNWIKVAEKFNQKFEKNIKSAKQCRQRFINHNKKNKSIYNNQQQWRQLDKIILYDLYQKYGPKWKLISQFISQKSQNSIKNKFYGSIRKFIRKLNLTGKNYRVLKKAMRQKSILRILDSPFMQTMPIELKQKSKILRNQILIFTKQENLQFEKEKLIQLINQINQFNRQSRSYRIWKNSFSQNIKFSNLFPNQNTQSQNRGDQICQFSNYEKQNKFISMHQDRENKQVRTPCKGHQFFSTQMHNQDQISNFMNEQKKKDLYSKIIEGNGPEYIFNQHDML